MHDQRNNAMIVASHVFVVSMISLLEPQSHAGPKINMHGKYVCQKVIFSCGIPLAVTMLSLWLSARYTSHQA